MILCLKTIAYERGVFLVAGDRQVALLGGTLEVSNNPRMNEGSNTNQNLTTEHMIVYLLSRSLSYNAQKIPPQLLGIVDYLEYILLIIDYQITTENYERCAKDCSC